METKKLLMRNIKMRGKIKLKYSSELEDQIGNLNVVGNFYILRRMDMMINGIWRRERIKWKDS